MIAHRRRDFAAGNHFSFSDPIQRAGDELNTSDGIEYETWAERIKGRYGYFGRSNDHKLGAWARRSAPGNNHKDPDYGEEEFRWLAQRAGDGSGTPSPELWKAVSPPATRSADASPIRDSERDKLIYPNPRAQAIARYRQEMLDMVRDMPETGYELSLRDIVETPRIGRAERETTAAAAATKGKGGDLPKDSDEKGKDQKKTTTKRRMSRSESTLPGGFLLKMFFPITAGGARTNSLGCPTTAGSKVSPRPIKPQGTDGEWWQKKNESGRTGSSSSSNSSNSNSRRRKSISSCYSFFHTWNGKGRGN